MSYRGDLKCEVEDCGRGVMAARLCATHYQRFRKRGHVELPKTSKQYKARYARWSNLKLRHPDLLWPTFSVFEACAGCPPDSNYSIYKKDETQPLGPDNFEWRQRIPGRSGRPRIFNTHTKEGKAAYDRSLRLANPDREKNYVLLRNYGVTVGEYNALLIKQKGACAICEKPEIHVRNGKLMPLSVDHDHGTGQVRGLLCLRCNRGLGFFRDDQQVMSRAISYLARASEQSPTVVPFKQKEA